MNKSAPSIFRSLFWIFIVAIVLSSCVPQKKMIYMQVKEDSDTLTNFVNDRKIDYRIQPGDNLYIRVVTLDEMTTMLLNPLTNSARGGAAIGGNDANIYLQSYTVNEAGYLDFPMTGEIFVRNMNVDEIRDAIKEKLSEYLKELVVVVKLVNFNITLLGEIKNPGIYKIYQTNINLFEAISLGRDLTDFANRNQIAIIRQTKTGSSVHYVDMTKRDILSSEFYYLKPNDIVYALPVKGKQFTFANFPYGVVFGFISTTILMLNYFQNN
ncbi:MAG: polysaccharide biosynthesis/export family protein [bacterium]|jgi:polysaccharide biosynthesis/export protein